LPPACAGNVICGHTYIGETYSPPTPGTPLNGIVVQLRDTNGNVIQTQPSSGGSYSFTVPATPPLTPPTIYNVSVAVPRGAVASPMGYQATIGSPVHLDFGVRNIPVPFQVQDVPGTFVLITPTSYNSNTPPTVNMNSTSPSQAWTKTIGQEGSVTMQVPRGSYYITCWKQAICSGKTTYRQTSSAPIYGGANLSPDAPPISQVSCPAITACP
jgi:hypothetical protein